MDISYLQLLNFLVFTLGIDNPHFKLYIIHFEIKLLFPDKTFPHLIICSSHLTTSKKGIFTFKSSNYSEAQLTHLIIKALIKFSKTLPRLQEEKFKIFGYYKPSK